MRICSIHGSLDKAFKDLGHEILSLRPKPGVHALDRELEQAGFVPDLLIQQETLGPRTLLDGLETITCPKLFWSVDTHLNAFWQQHYGRLFDLVLTTQHSWVHRMRALGLTAVEWLPWFGIDHPWTPWDGRQYHAAFVGRVTGHRPVRKAFAQFLEQEFKTAILQGLSFRDMVAVYANTRLAPNESILGEVNFRTFEAASCGCVVISQDLGDDLNVLFARNREILTYDHALDLGATVKYGLERPDAMRRMGAAARERVQKEHLPQHRAKRIIDLAKSCGSNARTGPAARASSMLTRFELWQAERLDVPGERILAKMLAIPLDPELLAALIALTCRLKTKEHLIALLAPILEQGQYQEDANVNLAGSMAALHVDEFSLARQFLYRQVKASKSGPRSVAAPLDVYRAWASELAHLGRTHRPGLLFDHTRHLPASALECLLEAHARWPKDLEVQRRMNSLLAVFRGTEQVRLALLSNLSLHYPGNWRDGLELAMVNLRMFRVRQGLEEAASALEAARGRGEEARFVRLLKAMDRTGTLLNALQKAGIF